MDQDREESDEFSELPALEPLQPSFALLLTDIRHGVLPPTTIKSLEPALHENRKKRIDQNKREIEEEENIDGCNAG